MPILCKYQLSSCNEQEAAVFMYTVWLNEVWIPDHYTHLYENPSLDLVPLVYFLYTSFLLLFLFRV